jgi:hypothetical protein
MAYTLADMAQEFPAGAGASVHLIDLLSRKNALFEEVFEIDKELIDLAPDKGLYRAQEASAALEAVANRISRELWYGSRTADYRAVVGLATRYSNLSLPQLAQYIIDAGGTGKGNSVNDERITRPRATHYVDVRSGS